jgi:AcrR family transcriptional regulator
MASERAQSLRADAARNYDRIVDAAGRAFEEIGPAVTLDEVARYAGVSAATLYRRFGNRDQLVRAVFEQLVTTELEPAADVQTDDPWQDLVTSIEASLDVLAGRQVVVGLARDTRAVDVENLHRYTRSFERLLQRAVGAGLVRPELQVRDLAAVMVMALATVHPQDPDGADRNRYLALLLEGMRPSPRTLPAPSTHHVVPER